MNLPGEARNDCRFRDGRNGEIVVGSRRRTVSAPDLEDSFFHLSVEDSKEGTGACQIVAFAWIAIDFVDLEILGGVLNICADPFVAI